MFDMWIKLKIWTEFIIPFSILGILIFVAVVCFVWDYIDSLIKKREK